MTVAAEPTTQPGAPASSGVHGLARNLARTAAALLSVQVVTWTSSLMAIVVIPRHLGAHDLGVLTTLTLVVATLARLGGLGMPQHLIREVARDPGVAPTLAGQAIPWRLLSATTLFAVGVALMLVFGAERASLAIFGLLALTNLAVLVQEVCLSCMQGNYSLGRVALATSATALLTQAGIVALVLAGGGIAAVVAGGLVGALASVTLAVLLFWRQFGLPTLTLRQGESLIRKSVPFLSWDVALLIYGSVDFLLLSLLADGDTVGRYALAYRLAGIPVFVAVIITSSIYPAVSRAHATRDYAWLRRAVTNACGLAVLATLPLAILMTLRSGTLVSLVSDGDEFSGSVVLLSLLLMHLPLVAFDTVLGMSLFACDRQRVVVIAAWLAAAVNITGNLVAIPVARAAFGDAAIGSAIMTILTELLMMALFVHNARGHLIMPALWSWLARTFAVSGLLAAVALLAAPLGPIVSSALAGLACLVLVYVAGGRHVLTPEAIRRRLATAPQ